MALVGYARVSTEEQATARRLDGLRAAGCAEVLEEHAYLLEVVEGLQARGVHFRSLRDPVDTASPQGLFTLQVLGAAAQLERALIRERTRSGMRAAAARGSRPGNPGPRRGRPRGAAQGLRGAARVVPRGAGRRAGRLAAAGPPAPGRRPCLGGGRPLPERAAPPGSEARRWAEERLVRAVRRLAAEGLAEPALLEPARPAPPPDRLLAVVAGIARSDPGATLRQVVARLEAIREPTPRSRARWAPGSVAHVLARARRAGLLPASRPPPEPQAAVTLEPAIPNTGGAQRVHTADPCNKVALCDHPAFGRLRRSFRHSTSHERPVRPRRLRNSRAQQRPAPGALHQDSDRARRRLRCGTQRRAAGS